MLLISAWAACGQDVVQQVPAAAEANSSEKERAEPNAESTATLPAKDEKTARKLAESSTMMRANLPKDFPGATVQKVKLKQSPNLIAMLMWDIPYEPDREYQVTLRDPLNKNFKVKYSVHGSLDSTDTFKTNRIPEKVAKAMKAWAPGAEWETPVEAKKRYSQPMLYEVRCRFEGKTYKAEIFEDGKFNKQDAIPGQPPPSTEQPEGDYVPKSEPDSKADAQVQPGKAP